MEREFVYVLGLCKREEWCGWQFWTFLKACGNWICPLPGCYLGLCLLEVGELLPDRPYAKEWGMLLIFHFPKFHTMRCVLQAHNIQRKGWKRKLEKEGEPLRLLGAPSWFRFCAIACLFLTLVCLCACLPLSDQLWFSVYIWAQGYGFSGRAWLQDKQREHACSIWKRWGCGPKSWAPSEVFSTMCLSVTIAH